MQLLLASYMERLSNILQHAGPQFTSQLKYLSETIAELRSEIMPDQLEQADPKSKVLELQQKEASFLGDRKLLRGMLKTKFGCQYLVSKAEVKKVQMSVSQVCCLQVMT